jgi:hypothetical protein
LKDTVNNKKQKTIEYNFSNIIINGELNLVNNFEETFFEGENLAKELKKYNNITKLTVNSKKNIYFNIRILIKFFSKIY